MNCFRNDYCSFYIYFLSISALFIYLYGFFPTNISSGQIIAKNDSEAGYYSARSVDKLAFILIDSLRYDFVLPKDGNIKMPFTTSSILKQQSCLVKIKTDSPTVTMPRIKAITSGAISNYIDVVLNLMSSNIENDNFIDKAKLNNIKILFYGDDTWLKLFPNAFLRSEGTNSFFALDFTQVDNNVTRCVYNEFKTDDWDIIILHYLGLDHIGHLEGPNNFLAKTKLKEMDLIIKNVSEYFKTLEKTKGIKTMVIVTGDHGMKDTGGHGGVTYGEITVPLISIENPCKILPGWPKNYTANQIDIASTISALLGLSPPAKCVGKIIPSLLHYMSNKEILRHLKSNSVRLKKLKLTSTSDFDFESLPKIAGDMLMTNISSNKRTKIKVQKYYHFLKEVTKKMLKPKSNFNAFYLFFGLLLLWVSLGAILIQIIYRFERPKKSYHWFLIFGVLIHSLSFGSTSFIEEEHQTWYMLWITFCILALLESLKIKNKTPKEKLYTCLSWIIICLSHRIFRKLNQTGDKWAFIPDIKSFLNSPEGHQWLTVVFFVGILIVACIGLMTLKPRSLLISYGFCLLFIVLYRINTGSIKVKYVELYTASRGTIEVFMFWTFLTIFSVQTFQSKSPKYLPWLLLASLLLRPHNILLPVLELYTSKQINKLFWKVEDQVWNNVAHIWMANTFYFYQGNSNSLANIDVAAGFIGVKTYNPLYAGIMIIAHTFSSQILSYILSPKSILIYGFLRLVPLTMYCTFLIFHLNHLFIWSVFSPKLLYESTITLLLLFLMFSNFIIKK